MILAYLYSFGLAVLHCFVPGMTEADPPQMVNRLARDVLGTGGRGDTEEAYPMTKSHITSGFAAAMMAVAAAALPSAPALRSEEHTSELQSLMRISYAVFCLKKKNTIQHT